MFPYSGFVVNLFFVDGPKSRWSSCTRDSPHVQDGQEQVRDNGPKLDPKVCHGLGQRLLGGVPCACFHRHVYLWHGIYHCIVWMNESIICLLRDGWIRILWNFPSRKLKDNYALFLYVVCLEKWNQECFNVFLLPWYVFVSLRLFEFSIGLICYSWYNYSLVPSKCFDMDAKTRQKVWVSRINNCEFPLLMSYLGLMDPVWAAILWSAPLYAMYWGGPATVDTNYTFVLENVDARCLKASPK